MKKYIKQSKCPKCGIDMNLHPHVCDACKKNLVVDFVDTRFISKDRADRIHVNGQWIELESDVMLRTCTGCGFQWLEKPL
jgi:hypothetical protein